ncbi:arabinan endo-1,5-alpha-L-arabinosidase [Bacteroides sp. 224]|uniref:arabinan endo-1,5-alpha-L-arabinosidase n=1 Tax=Bacteroides sp. 224 TaxID=2302936 RepID=UPI0013D39B79|nr:arabinan endo-1,5-alpha-L-arabinosidase [Bacteroides sp. 224]NDV66210.1 arabinan endo-1,5-alpha-L-arabinosidase [Bacteroides sp. 224]
MRRNLLLSTTFLLCLFACKQAAFTPIPSENPWKDNYRSVARMEDYRQWGTYNVHDPACKKFGDFYYMYSTDAIYAENQKEAKEKGVPLGFIQVRKSKDLINWDFVGWAFPEIPQEAVTWVREHADGKGATNIWAPYIIKYEDTYRLYYCVSAFGKKISYIGLAESDSPEGPWIQKGCVVKTNNESVMNAIDPSVIVDPATGKWWMHYGSYFGGLFCVELDEATGLTKVKDDQGHLVARRANYKKDNLEAPEIIYNPELKQYFLFMSYDPLMTTYNVRVGRSDKPEGPFTDFLGQDLKDTQNNFPILTAPYQFKHHPGWAGTAHCAMLEDNGKYYMFHQARLSPQNQMMVLHVRETFFNSEGWPVVSPERYAATKKRTFNAADLVGEWEVLRVIEPLHERQLEAGQILWGEGELKDQEWNKSFSINLLEGGLTGLNEMWSFLTEKQSLKLNLKGEELNELFIFAGQDWENEKETILFTGLDSRGRSVWGKRVK